jgi:hypothetical protein
MVYCRPLVALNAINVSPLACIWLAFGAELCFMANQKLANTNVELYVPELVRWTV